VFAAFSPLILSPAFAAQLEKRENSLLRKQIKANKNLIMGDNKALELEKTRSVHRCYKASLKDAFVRVLSYEVTISMAWRQSGR
jgi:hypothetical protein